MRDDLLPPRVEQFLDELRAICRKHKMTLDTSLYDPLAVYDLRDGDAPLPSDEIQDRRDDQAD